MQQPCLAEVEGLYKSEDGVVALYRTGAQIAVDIFHGRWPESVVNPCVAEVTARVTDLRQASIR